MKSIVKNSTKKRDHSTNVMSSSQQLSQFKLESPTEKNSLYSSPTEKTLKKNTFKKGFCVSNIELTSTDKKKDHEDIITSSPNLKNSLPNLKTS